MRSDPGAVILAILYRVTLVPLIEPKAEINPYQNDVVSRETRKKKSEFQMFNSTNTNLREREDGLRKKEAEAVAVAVAVADEAILQGLV